ncbi:MAG TPA: outer membrane protein transport protein [Rhodanobacteraceae bacterium]|nr:outer membrane protein transport protein [Rhodanobacteraceae bacterium]
MTPNPIDGRRNAPVLALAALAVAVAGALASSPAQASGFQLKENSAKALGRAFAGSTAGPADPSVVANNPAAMTELQGTTFGAGLTVISFKTEFTGSGTDGSGQPLTGGNGGNGGTTAPVPALFYSTPMGERGRFGFALTVPYGFTTEYPRDWKGRYKAVKSKLQTIDGTFSYAYEFSDSFSLGASAIVQHTSADLTSMVDYGSLLGAPQQADGLARVTGSSTDYGWQLGFLWKMGSNDRLALNYRAKISHTLEGNASFHDVPSQLGQLVALGNFQNTTGRADFATPSVLHLSYWHQAGPRFGFGLDVARTDWSSFDELRIQYGSAQADTAEPEQWDATMLYALGGDYRLNDNWTLRAGVAYDETPTNDLTRTPRVPDGSRRWLSFGFTWQPSDSFEVDLGYAHLWVDSVSIDDTPLTGTGGPMGSTLAGSFDSSANLLGASLTYKF